MEETETNSDVDDSEVDAADLSDLKTTRALGNSYILKYVSAHFIAFFDL